MAKPLIDAIMIIMIKIIDIYCLLQNLLNHSNKHQNVRNQMEVNEVIPMFRLKVRNEDTFAKQQSSQVESIVLGNKLPWIQILHLPLSNYVTSLYLHCFLCKTRIILTACGDSED